MARRTNSIGWRLLWVLSMSLTLLGGCKQKGRSADDGAGPSGSTPPPPSSTDSDSDGPSVVDGVVTIPKKQTSPPVDGRAADAAKVANLFLVPLQASAWKDLAGQPGMVLRERIAQALQLDPQDSNLDRLAESRDLLGDIDYSAGVLPDDSWTPTKLSVLLLVLKNTCELAPVKDRLSTVEGFSQFFWAAYGRGASNEEMEMYRASKINESLVGLCMAFLSSTEFVLVR